MLNCLFAQMVEVDSLGVEAEAADAAEEEIEEMGECLCCVSVCCYCRCHRVQVVISFNNCNKRLLGKPFWMTQQRRYHLAGKRRTALQKYKDPV